MYISVFGFGYVGCVTAACLAASGHRIIGVDVNQEKVDLVNSGRSPIVERGVDQLISSHVKTGAISATRDVGMAVNKTEISIVCVGTPSKHNGDLDVSHVLRVCEEIGEALRQKDVFHLVVMRSTILPGTMRSLVIPTIEKFSGLTAGEEFGICFNPEFLREGTAISDYADPPKTVIGQIDNDSGERLMELYKDTPGPVFRVNLEEAECVKYADNAWHALKVCFANEIGNIAKELSIDSHKVMEIFCSDQKLNLSAYYLKPGFAFGGSCLPKDVRALTYLAKQLDLSVPILNSINDSNWSQVKRGISLIESLGKKKLSFLGFAFKAGTDDMRESPIVSLIEYFLGKGYDIKIYDKSVNIAFLTGANRENLRMHLPHIEKLMIDQLSAAIDFAEVLIVGNKSEEFIELPENSKNKIIVDLVRVKEITSVGDYHGICW